jgi:hypothetical protein
MVTRRIASTPKLAPWIALAVILLLGYAAPSTHAQGGMTAPADAPDAGAFRAATPAQDGPIATPALDRLSPPYHPGWPQTMGTHSLYKPVGVVLADVDADGLLEVLAGSTDNLFRVWRQDGTLMPGWPVNVGGQVQSKGAAADLDGDGDLEILVCVKGGPLRIFHHDGTPLAGWPQTSGVPYGFISPTVYDLTGDGAPEVLIGGGNTVRAWLADGTPFFSTNIGANITGTLAIGDINGDQLPEVLAVTLSGTLCALDNHGVALTGSPATFGLSTSYAAPSIGDIDADGQSETLVVGYNFGVSTSIYAYRWTPTGPVVLAGFPVTYPSLQTYSCPVIGDADGDGDLELWNAGKINGPAFYAWDHTGAVLPGWPVTADPNMEGSAILVDFDGSPNMEVAVGDNWNPGVVFGHNLNGTVATNFPLSKPGASGPNSPEVGDVDGDGQLELAFTMMTGDVGVWDFPVAYADSRVEWGALFHDDWNTNQYGFVVPSGGAEIDTAPSVLGAGPLRLVPNPAFGPVAIPFSLDRTEQVQLGVYDVQGREVVRIFSGRLNPGQGGLAWDGRDAAGRFVPAGVYRVRYEGTRSGVRTGRVVILR